MIMVTLICVLRSEVGFSYTGHLLCELSQGGLQSCVPGGGMDLSLPEIGRCGGGGADGGAWKQYDLTFEHILF